MWDLWTWLKAAHIVHAVLAILFAIAAFRFAVRTRFWFPRYVHYLAGFALALGMACLALMPPDAPIQQDGLAGLKKAVLVLLFPGIVYFVFVFYGGQRVAYERTHTMDPTPCPYCHAAMTAPGSRCSHCGQS